MKFWKTKEFSEINKKWQKKLATSGFVDIEKEIDGVLELKQNHFYVLNKRLGKKVDPDGVRQYYTLIDQNLNAEENIPKRDMIIMSSYCAGMPQKEILKELKKKGVKCRHRCTITRVITRYLLKWNIPLLKKRKTI